MTGSLATVDAVIIGAFLVVTLIAGVAMSKVAARGMDDYFLGGRKIPWWVLGISSATSNFDMAGTMVIVAVVFSLGYGGFLVELRGGVGLTLAFLMVFLAKWLRRSRVMTSAEWMRHRFGTDRQGTAAHLLSAVANLLLSLGMIVYFCKGAGKFLTFFLPFDEVTCTSVMVAVGLFYTLASGLYGVVFTDVLQMGLLTLTAVYVTVTAFNLAPSVELPAGFLDFGLGATSEAGASLLAQDPGQWGPIFEMFGLCVAMWMLRTVLEGMGGVGGYTDQRFFAARSEREASLLTMESVVLSVLRWTLVAGLVVMGYAVVAKGGAGADLIGRDPEQVLPVVLGEWLPAGMRGLVISGLIAAAMSTFDSTLNAGASYLVRDIYQTYLNPAASERRLVSVSRWSTTALCLVAVALASLVPSINEIWSLITMGLGAGLFVPLFLRWYWPRFNGFGFAVGTGVGIVAGLVFNRALAWPLYTSFPAIIASALVASIVASLLTAPTPRAVLVAFAAQTNPWGPWRAWRQAAVAEGRLTPDALARQDRERRNDVVALVFALPFQFSLLLAGMAFVWHDWTKLGVFAGVAAVGAVGLRFFWYANLPSAAEADAPSEETRAAG
jgi:Na+/proline symporter